MDNKTLQEKMDVVVCRPALPLDMEDVLRFTSRIWDGGDYVPTAWHKWLSDPEGACYVAEYRGHAIGLVKLSLLAPGQWWIMGLRVDPDYQNLGVASRLHNTILNYWESNCSGVVRFSTLSTNIHVHHLAERTGFLKILETTSYISPAITGQESPFRLARERELHEVCEFVFNAPTNMLTVGLVDLDWEWVAVDKTILQKAIVESRLRWWHQKAGLIMTVENTEEEIHSPLIQYLGCPLEKIHELLTDYRALAGKLGYSHGRWIAPLIPRALEPLERAGYTCNWEDSLFIYEKYAPKK
ncbi:MAG: GNAT family N-acetyltransferase [Anaerolineaceae bacterium]